MSDWRINALAGLAHRQVVSAADSVSLGAAPAVHVALNLVIRVLAALHVRITLHLARHLICHHHELVRVLSAVDVLIGNL